MRPSEPVRQVVLKALLQLLAKVARPRLHVAILVALFHLLPFLLLRVGHYGKLTELQRREAAAQRET